MLACLRWRTCATLAVALSLATMTNAGPARAVPWTFPILRHPANGTLLDYAISEDQRYAHLVAFASNATNVVRGAGGAHYAIFVTERAGSFANEGSIWRPGHTSAPVRGFRGREPDGDVFAPALGGGVFSDGSCMGFISNATNLVHGAPAHIAEGYVEDLHTRAIRMVSVNALGAPANGPVTSLAVDGQCARVAFTSTATNLTDGARALPSARAPGGVSEVYVHVVDADGFPDSQANRGHVGDTFLASANRAGEPSNGDCAGVRMATWGGDLSYSCTATNLDAHTSRESNVYTTQIAPGGGSPYFRPLGTLIRSTRLVSVNRGGREGNGPSDHAVIDAYGEYVTYRTDASNLAAGATGVPSIVRADITTRPITQDWISHPFQRRGPANGPSDNPTTDYHSAMVFFDSAATNIVNPGRTDDNDAPDIFLWTSAGDFVRLRSRPCDLCAQLPGSSTQPVTSWLANYTLFDHVGQLWMRYIPK
jgi:hypothetical protein